MYLDSYFWNIRNWIYKQDTSLFCYFQVKDLFPLGKDTICVKASQNPGIVKFSNSFLTCSTCESSSCIHTGVVGDLIRDIVNEENLENQPDEVLEWLLSHAEGKKTSVTYKPRVVSWKKIPFHYPDELCDLLQKPSDQRFHNWQCNLDKPDKCDACHNESFDQHCRTIDVISDSFIHPFKGNLKLLKINLYRAKLITIWHHSLKTQKLFLYYHF